MKLSKKDKEELRTKLETILKDVKFDPENRIHIPKGKLEQILFDYDTKRKCKIIGYKTDNLCKIDLSEISFDGVDLNSGKTNLSNTNVKINFNKLHYALSPTYGNVFYVASNVDFTNVDLVGMKLAGASVDNERNHLTFNSCNFTDTHIWSSFDDVKGSVWFRDCDFTGRYFNEKFIDKWNGELEKRNIRYQDCTFTNTGATIVSDHDFECTAVCKNIEKFRGCYLQLPNNKTMFIKRINELEEEKKCILEQYKAFEERRINQIIETIRMSDELTPNEDGTIPTYISTNEGFRLNRKGIEKLRLQIHVAFAGKSFSKRVKLPKDIMEIILFDKEKDEKGNTVKRIAIDGDIAKLFDYSEIDFENVSLDCKENAEKNHVVVSLNETANIDFSKTYEYKTDNQLVASYIDLRGVKLEAKDMQALTKESIATFTRVNLEGADIQMNEYVNAFFFECNLRNVFLGNIQLNLDSKDCAFNGDLKFIDCNLRDTGVNLIDYKTCSDEDFKNVYRDNNYLGCFVNGKPIKSLEDMEEKKKNVLEAYSKYSRNTINQTLSLVRKQVREAKEKE